ncbi:MAG: c-type cytochrome [Chitinophagaceae bacterium]|nr:c-type cytochrome [Chitinophagaceae bacterium]
MNLFQLIKKKIILIALLLPTAIGAAAQDAAQTVANNGESSNLLANLLIIITIVLALIIWGMGQALVGISKLAVEKQKQSGAALGIILLIGFSLLAQTGFAQGTPTAAADAAKETLNYGGLSAHNFWAFVGVILIEVAAIFFLAFSIRRVYQELIVKKEAVKSSAFGSWWDSLDKKFFTKAVPVEKEADVLLDHNYDGIQELDNALPPWWKYGFYITIAFAFIYIGYFHAFGSGKNPTEEYAAEMDKARIEKEAYEATNKDKVDENNILMADAAGIANGQKLFDANCVACHLKDGGGSVGPNLTDDYWLHKGSLNDIFHTIKVGYPDKGMQSWAKTFSPKEISQLTSFIKSLKGTKPAVAKAPQGDLYTEEIKTDTTAAPKLDSLKVTKDTATVKAAK